MFFTFCSSWPELMYGSVEMLSMFAGGLGLSRYVPTMGDHLTTYQRDLNLDFIQKAMNITLEERIIDEVVIDKS